ncbi:hypothetical protein BU24DRAFT_232886 [Aaosphaeria arxii CBS 175.79]|uniref:Glycoprotease family protein n=1 Tax=Aaosphaeria arxii CBS 175.79 TaxID=1450172 RepID=A0A6A5XK93_9PLEO|nr:uncharacterized protein BU24DRAFT_232886 [Aaosphaeria arxii CBS 175.79]KAF2013237.1 hypothetical protein BU24DRAFT_232886 [Aaosphaeria arxii CBS 175.79]
MSNAYAGSFGQTHTDAYHESQPYNNNTYAQSDTTTLENVRYEGDAQIAARRAMSKRNSRSYSARVARVKSWKKKERLMGKPAKPTIDTSFTRHKGMVPRQMYPQESHVVSRGSSVSKHNFLGLGRSSTRMRGLGIMKGTPQPEVPREDVAHKDIEHKGVEALAPAEQTWTEISPSDRPIPIGISIPSDSIADFSPYQSTRLRSASDATLVTPSIIVTPAAAMKSVWSPDTESEYTPSVYSRATFNPSTMSNVPPVPAIPADVSKSAVWKPGNDASQMNGQQFPSRPRHDTLDSAGTAFEDDESPVRPKERITSTATVFEEDEIPLRSKEMRSHALSIDTASVVPTPRRSQGWWNFITTPFEFTRANSTWTQNGRHADQTPDIPMMPQQMNRAVDSPSTPSTYIWSATEKSPSDDGRSLNMTIALSTALANQYSNEKSSFGDVGNNKGLSDSFQPTNQTRANERAFNASEPVKTSGDEDRQQQSKAIAHDDTNVTSPLSAMSASPVIGTAAIGTVLNARQIQEPPQQYQAFPPPPPITIHIEMHDRTREGGVETSNANSQRTIAPAFESSNSNASSNAPTQTITYFPPPPPARSPQHTPPPQIYGMVGTQRSSPAPISQPPPEFLPPPRVAYSAHNTSDNHNSRSSTPVSEDVKLKKQKPKKHRKVFNLMEWLPWKKRADSDKDPKAEKKSNRRRKLCLGCCCCIIILILLAIIIPIIVVVVGRNSNHNNNNNNNNNGNGNGNSDNAPEAAPLQPGQWMNLTGYPPIPTGISTISQPEAVDAEKGCVATSTIWSCAIPKDDQKTDSRNKPDQPNLKIEITFENGTVRDPSKTLPARRAVNPVSAGALVRSRFLNSRAEASAVPAPPSTADYNFLGNTTDANQQPFEGEETPFFVTLLNPDSQKAQSRRLALRADSDPASNITSGIPDPSLDPDGTAAAANLFPTASHQPLRLFNRGKPDEHYGYFVYYDRSIFLKDISRNFTNGGNPADVDGGSRKDAATLRCTWSQTRFLVQIWTRSQASKPLLRSGSGESTDPLIRPGTFPYPVTVMLDRHGGRADKKMVYCYKMEKDGTIVNKEENKSFVLEDRRFGGTLVNPARGISQNVQGPVDGGTGGCACKWQNWSTA